MVFTERIKMARAGVTFTDIAKAAEKVKSQGHEPTVDRVREILGTGSKSTIAPLLKKWKNNMLNNDNGTDIPNELLEVVKSLYENTQALADLSIQKIKEECELRLNELGNKLNDSNGSNSKLLDKVEKLDKKVSKYKDTIKVLNKEAEILNINNSKNEFVLNENINQILELKTTITELKKENKDIREHFEHYQQSTANDRQLEREQFLLSNQQLNDQIKSFNIQKKEAESESEVLKNTISENQEIIKELNNNLKKLDLSYNKVNLESNILNEKYVQTKSINKNLNLQIIKTEEKFNQVNIDNSVMTKENKLLNDNLNSLSLELDKVKYNLSEMTIANTSNLQEKSVLQGQLKQLHDSLNKN
jgi:chromosome segregation ATPase